MISTRFAPRWLGWLAMAGGAGLVLSLAIWTSSIWLLPYGFFWLWVITVRSGYCAESRHGRRRREPTMNRGSSP